MAHPSVPLLIARLYENLGYLPSSTRPVRGFREKTYNWRRQYLAQTGRSSRLMLDWHLNQPEFLKMATAFLVDRQNGVENGEYHWPPQQQIIHIDGGEVPQYPRDEASIRDFLSQVFWRQSKHEWQNRNRNRQEYTQDEDFDPTLMAAQNGTPPSKDVYTINLRPDKKRLRELSLNESEHSSFSNTTGESTDFLSRYSASDLPGDAATTTLDATKAPVATMMGPDGSRDFESLDSANNSHHKSQSRTLAFNASKTRKYERESNLKRRRADFETPSPTRPDLEFIQVPPAPRVPDAQNSQGHTASDSSQRPTMTSQSSTHGLYDPHFHRSQTVLNAAACSASTDHQVTDGPRDPPSKQAQSQPNLDATARVESAGQPATDGPKFHITYMIITQQGPRRSCHVWSDGRLSNRSVENLFEEVGDHVGLSGIERIKFVLQGKLMDYNFVVHCRDEAAYKEMQAFLNKVIKREMRENQPPYEFDMDLVIGMPMRPNLKEEGIGELTSASERDVDGNL